MSDKDREYYMKFADEAQEEYKYQHREFRATGGYKTSRTFQKLEGGKGPWVRICADERNELEKEVVSYNTVVFPLRPPNIEKPSCEAEREKTNRERKEK